MTPRPGFPSRVAAVDALRALALLPVVVVNALTYAELPDAGFFSSLAGAPWWDSAAVLAVATLLQGKGIALLMFLFGYSMGWARAPRQRLRRLLGVGLAHGGLLYQGDIVHQYALVGLWMQGARRWRWPRLLRWTLVWTAVGSALVLLSLALGFLVGFGEPTTGPRLVTASTGSEWWWLGASGFFGTLPWALLFMGPGVVAVVSLGLIAGRLRLLHHRRWRPWWARAARWAGLMLVLNLVYGVWVVVELHQSVGMAAVGTLAMTWLGPLTLAAWVPWLLLRVRWPAWLVHAGRNTLTMYIGSSLLIVLALAGPAAAWQPSPAELTLAAAMAWVVLAALSAGAAARGWRLPLEALLAWRRA